MIGQDADNLGEYLIVQGLKGFIDNGLALVETPALYIHTNHYRRS